MNSTMQETIIRRSDVMDRLTGLLIESLDLDLKPEEITEDAALFGIGLGLDSVDALQLVVGVEMEFDVSLPEDDMSVYRSINTLTDFILNNTVQQGA